MAENSLSPAFIKLYYSAAGRSHVATIPTKFFGTPVPGVAPNLTLHNGGSNTFTSFMAGYIAAWKVFFDTITTFDYADVWSQPTPEDDPVWIFTYASGAIGTSVTDFNVASELVMTFRTDQGGILRTYAMEQAEPSNVFVSYASMGSAAKAYADLVMAATSAAYGRDGGAPVACLGYKTKTNDVLRRKILTG